MIITMLQPLNFSFHTATGPVEQHEIPAIQLRYSSEVFVFTLFSIDSSRSFANLLWSSLISVSSLICQVYFLFRPVPSAAVISQPSRRVTSLYCIPGVIGSIVFDLGNKSTPPAAVSSICAFKLCHRNLSFQMGVSSD